MDDLLKEAIADAKAVRETALANAKIALEEAFTPRLTSMLSQKIQHEVEGDAEEGEYAEEEEAEVAPEAEIEVAPEAEAEAEAEVAPEDEFEAPEEDADAAMRNTGAYDDGEEDEVVPAEEEDVVEINGVKYAPVVSEEEAEEGEEAPVEEDESFDEDELDLESILRELEEDDEEPVAEDLQDTSEIGDADNKVDDDSNASSETGAPGPEGEGSAAAAGDEGEEETVDDLQEADDAEEDIDLDEVLKALSEEEDADETQEENAKLQTELKEHRDVVRYLRAKLNEVNLLNAKLLFSNKLFRTFGLTNEQKMKVVETFDRTKNLREIKLVYSTLAESFGQVKKPTIKESVRKGSSSKAVASTKPKKEVISEGDDLKARFKKLANII